MSKKYLLALPLLVLAGGCFGGKKLTPFDMDSRRLGVVMNFNFQASDLAFVDMQTSFPDELSRALFDTNRLRVIDRARLKTTLGEEHLHLDQPLDSAQMASVAKQLKSEVTVYGDILSVERTVANHNHNIKDTLTVTVDAKLVLSSTAEILSRGQASVSETVKYKEGTPPPAEVLVNKAMKDAATQIAYQLAVDLQPK